MADKSSEKQKDGIDGVVIPKGYDLVLVKVGELENVEPNCPHCGGSSLHTAPECDYCGVSRTHYEYKKEGTDDTIIEKVDKDRPMQNEYTVDVRSLAGEIKAHQVTIKEESVVGNIVSDDTVYMENKSSAGFVTSQTVRTQGGVNISQMATSVLDTNGPLKADMVMIYNNGSYDIGFGSNISELRLGKGVKDPSISLMLSVKKTTHGNFPRPKAWEK